MRILLEKIEFSKEGLGIAHLFCYTHVVRDEKPNGEDKHSNTWL
jgi:hypothetical protein